MTIEPNAPEQTQPEATSSETPTTDPKSLVSQQPEMKPAGEGEFVPLDASSLKFEEGVTVNEGARDEFLGILNDRNLSPAEQAQKLVDLQTRLSREASETGSQAWADLQSQWQDEVRSDPDIGGAKLETNLAAIGKLVDQFGTPELRAVMDLTGAGNNVHVIKFCANIAKALTEGGFVSGQPAAPAQSAAERLYPSMAKGA